MNNSLARRPVFALALMLFAASVSFADSTSRKQGSFELFFGNYSLSDNLFKEVYPQGTNAIRGIMISSAIAYGFDFYAQIKAFSKMGALTYTREETKFFMLPLSLGLRYAPPTSYVIPYLGGGADFYLYYETNPIGTTLNVAKGFHVLGGLYIEFGKNFPIRLSAMTKYTWAKSAENDQSIQLGGLEYGGGIAVVF